MFHLCKYAASASICFAMLLAAIGCGRAEQKQIDRTEAQVERLVSELDARTTETGVYVRAAEGDMKEKDAWGTPIQVRYLQGGVAEVLHVCSAGPDKTFHTPDDITRSGIAMNLTGIGEGIKQNSEETAANVARGVVKGTVDGVKGSVKDLLPFGKKDKTASDADTSDHKSSESDGGAE